MSGAKRNLASTMGDPSLDPREGGDRPDGQVPAADRPVEPCVGSPGPQHRQEAVAFVDASRQRREDQKVVVDGHRAVIGHDRPTCSRRLFGPRRARYGNERAAMKPADKAAVPGDPPDRAPCGEVLGGQVRPPRSAIRRSVVNDGTNRYVKPASHRRSRRRSDPRLRGAPVGPGAPNGVEHEDIDISPLVEPAQDRGLLDIEALPYQAPPLPVARSAAQDVWQQGRDTRSRREPGHSVVEKVCRSVDPAARPLAIVGTLHRGERRIQ